MAADLEFRLDFRVVADGQVVVEQHLDSRTCDAEGEAAAAADAAVATGAQMVALQVRDPVGDILPAGQWVTVQLMGPALG